MTQKKKYNNPFLKVKQPLDPRGESTIPILRDAIAHHHRGQLKQAQAMCNKILEIEPRHVDAIHLLGVIAYQTGNHQVAVDLFSSAIEVNPNIADFYSNRGVALQELKQLDDALVSYNKAISLQPDYIDAYYNRGNALKELKQFEAAVASYDKAIVLRPDYAEAFSNRGNVLKELKQLEAAVASYMKAIELKPDYAEAYSNLGSALKELKQFEAAVASYNKAISLQPGYAEAYSNRGNVLKELKQLEAAVASYMKAIELKPDYAEAYSNLGNTLKELKRFDEALASYKRAINLKPDLAEAFSNQGNVFNELKQFEAAVASYDKAIVLRPDFEYLFGTKLHMKMHLCDWQDFELNTLELILKIQKNEKASPSFPTLALPLSLADQRQAAEIYSGDKYPNNTSLGSIIKSVRKQKICIGYYSSDFHAHPVSLLTVGLFENHDKTKFELIAFSFGPDIKDEIRSRINKAFDQFIDIRAKSDREVAIISRSIGIDIAIDLGGHTQYSRTGIFSYRAAPVQLSYVGYLGTMGANYYDYLIADSTLISLDTQAFYSEKIIYLPSYQVNDNKQEISTSTLSRQDLNLPSSGFVFCCFYANYKIIPSTFDGWMRILRAVPESVLLLYSDVQTASENLKLEAQKRGVNPERLYFGKKLIRSKYLARCRAADLFLDTLPYNAGATASDALWAGLPVLTCAGESFASRYAASLLKAIGLPELVTETQSEYEALAIELATNPAKLKVIKNKLDINRLRTPLFDTPRFTKNLEAALIAIHERYQSNLPPDHILITESNPIDNHIN